MEERRSSGRSKRLAKHCDEGFWDCSVCTYKNSPEAFKCEMCDVRKGTSTRKPRLNAQLVAQQVAQQYAPPLKKEKMGKEGRERRGGRDGASSSASSSPTGSGKRHKIPRLKNIDRSTAEHMTVTVNNVTVIITDYKPKKERRISEDNHNNNNTSTDTSDSASNSAREMNGDVTSDDNRS